MTIMQPYSMRRLIVVAMATVPLVGCIGFLFEKPRPGTDYGEFPERYEEIIVSFGETVVAGPNPDPFYSPDKRKLELHGYMFKEPRKAYYNEPLIKGGDVVFVGYAVQFSVSVNSVRQSYAALIRDGEVVDIVDKDVADIFLHFVR